MKIDFKPYQTKNRFWVEKFEEGAQVVDVFAGMTLSANTVNQCNQLASFARAYVKKHGDIDLAAFPHSLDQELEYDTPTFEPEEDDRPWYFGPNAPNGYRLYN